MKSITPFLWFNNQAEEAAAFYTSVFKNSRKEKSTRYDEAGAEVSGQPAGSVMTVPFRLGDQDFVALNGGPLFKFTEAISFVVNCESQEEVDYYWDALSVGGEEGQCGWLKDKFGVSWQVVPVEMGKILGDPDKEKAGRAMEAMLKMKKIDLAVLRKAAG